MPNVYLSTRTTQLLDTLANDLPQSIVFTGPQGIGLSSAVAYVADKLKTRPIYVFRKRYNFR
jgi:hypothetical protein